MDGILHAVTTPEFEPGQMVGRYRVECMLARGGMGIVYKAWDTRLERAVALKLLSAAHFDDPAVRQRFLREARAASALNHPNIVTIYEIGSENGADFITMEYLAGESVDRMIPADGLPLQEALEYSIAVADALATAHAAGIVHRDVKPRNVMVTASRVVKLLDFGLARRVLVSEPSGSTLTQAGDIVGTPAYMSPEQAEGKPADERSDIFSFGVLLYEMLTGQRAFHGDSTAATLAAVLTADPPPVRSVSPQLNKLTFRCLRKQPATRIQSMADVRLRLGEIRRGTSKRWFARRWLRAAGAAVVLACAALLLWLAPRAGKPAPGDMALAPLTTLPGYENHPSFSPDGRQVAYARCTAPMGGTCDLYVLELSSGLRAKGEPRRLSHQGQVIMSAAWLPDGQSLLYAAGPCQESPHSLWRAAVFGKDLPARILIAGWDAVSPAISRAGGRLAFSRKSADMDIWIIRAGSTAPVRLIASTWNDGNAQLSPDGKRIAFASGRSGGCPEIWVSDAQGANLLQLTNDRIRYQGTPRWSPDGQWIAFDHYGEDGHSDVHLMDADGRGRRRFTTFASDEGVPSWSRDGKWIYFRSNRTGSDEIWKMPVLGGQPIQVTDAGGYVAFESFDREHVYYLKSGLVAGQPLFKRSLAGGPEHVAIPDSVGFRAFLPVSDGIYYLSPAAKHGTAHVLKFYNFTTGRAQVLAALEGALALGLSVSSDRKSIVFTMSQTAGADLMLVENFH